jgi:hypothetical protein
VSLATQPLGEHVDEHVHGKLLVLGVQRHEPGGASASDGVFQPRDLSRPSVEFGGDLIEVVVGEAGKVGAGAGGGAAALVFSLVPRCQGECGSQKNTAASAATEKRACSTISSPWSRRGAAQLAGS